MTPLRGMRPTAGQDNWRYLDCFIPAKATMSCTRPKTPTATQRRYANFRLGYGSAAPVEMRIAIAEEARRATIPKRKRRRTREAGSAEVFMSQSPVLDVQASVRR